MGKKIEVDLSTPSNLGVKEKKGPIREDWNHTPNKKKQKKVANTKKLISAKDLSNPFTYLTEKSEKVPGIMTKN